MHRRTILAALVCAPLSACSEHSQHCMQIDAPHAMITHTARKTFINVDDDGVAIMGYDPVAYFTDHKPVLGSHEFMSVHDGAIYHFASAEHKAMFDSAPEKYAPQFGGWCAYAASINKVSTIGPEWWEIVDGRLLLQHNQKAWDLWHKDPAASLVKADQNWPSILESHAEPMKVLVNVDDAGLALQGRDPVAYFTDNQAAVGSPDITSSHNGGTYRFTSLDHKRLFDADPEKYAPEFGGFCGYGASVDKVIDVDVNVFQIQDGRLVLQHSLETYKLYNNDAQGSYTKAEHNWPHLVARACPSSARDYQ